METSTDIPPVLSELGVVSASKRQYGYDIQYEFTFSDGDTFAYQPHFSTAGNQDTAPQYQLKAIVEAIQRHRVQS